MTTPLNRDEQARVDRVAALEAAQRRGEHVWPHELNGAKQLAEMAQGNAEARQRYQAKLAAERQAKAQEQEAAEQQRIEHEVAAYKQRARAGFPGTSEQFEAAWPEILKRWQVDQAVDALKAHDPAISYRSMF